MKVFDMFLIPAVIAVVMSIAVCSLLNMIDNLELRISNLEKTCVISVEAVSIEGRK